MSILTSTGAGRSSMKYINNVHYIIGFNAEQVALKIKYKLLVDSQFSFAVRPVLSQKRAVAWMFEKEKIGSPINLVLKWDIDNLYQKYNELENHEEFISLLKKALYKELHDVVEKAEEKVIGTSQADTKIKGFILTEEDSFFTTNFFPDNTNVEDFF